MAKRKKAATKARRAKAKSAPKAKRPDGSISAGIYDAVEKLVADGKMKRSAAFRRIAKETGRKEGAVSMNYYYAAKKRGGTKRSATKKAADNAGKGAKAAAPKAAGISATIYDAIEKLMAGAKMTRAAAFRQLAKATGRKEGTVAVNYYYAAKKRGAKPGRRGPGRPRMAAGARNGAGSRLDSALKSLAELIRAQEADLASLRRENAQFTEIRKLVARI